MRFKKTLKTLAIVLGIIMLLAAGLLMWFSMLDRRMDAASETFARNQTELLLTKMDHELLLRMADDSLLESTSKMDFLRLFNVLEQKLGSFRRIQSCEGRANIDLKIGGDAEVTAYYELESVFEKGTVTVQMYLIKYGSTWRIKAFHIKS